jgi:Na+-driven multidrug efflux pump
MLTFIKLFLAYVPLAWLLSRAIGLEGIFWANTVAHLLFGAVGYWWIRRVLGRIEAARLPVAGVTASG